MNVAEDDPEDQNFEEHDQNGGASFACCGEAIESHEASFACCGEAIESHEDPYSKHLECHL